MLVLCRQAPVFGFHRPAVFHGADAVITGIQHRFYGERHARLQYHTTVVCIVVQNLWLFMEAATDTVTAVFTNNIPAIAAEPTEQVVLDVAVGYLKYLQ